MTSIRFVTRGRVNKPLPAALSNALPAIKDNLTDLQSYSVKLNAGKPDEEQTNKVEWGATPEYIWWVVDLAVPQPMPAALQTKLPALKSAIRQLKSYAVNTGEAAVFAKYHICHHEDNPPRCELDQDI